MVAKSHDRSHTDQMPLPILTIAHALTLAQGEVVGGSHSGLADTFELAHNGHGLREGEKGGQVLVQPQGNHVRIKEAQAAG